jgi:hypothetical protein
MSAVPEHRDELEDLRLIDREHWQEGPPHALFEQMRGRCPVHWSDGITEYPSEAGFWSVTTADDIHTVSRDWQTYSSAHGITTVSDGVIPLPLIQAMFIGMDPPKHDRLKALFQRGFTPKRIGRARGRDPRDHPPCSTASRARHLRSRRGGRPAGRRARSSLVHGRPRGGRREWAGLMTPCWAPATPS